MVDPAISDEKGLGYALYCIVGDAIMGERTVDDFFAELGYEKVSAGLKAEVLPHNHKPKEGIMENWKPSKVSHRFLVGEISREAKVVCFPHCEDKMLLIMRGSQMEDQILYCEGKDGINGYLWDRNFCWIVAGSRVGRIVKGIPDNLLYHPPPEMLDSFYNRAKEVRDNPAPTIQEDAARRVTIRRELFRLIKQYIVEEDKKRDGEYQVWGLYDNGWEYVVTGEDKDDALRLLKEYRENDRDHLYKLRLYRGDRRINKTLEG